MKTVTLEEKLIAQAKNINMILKSDKSPSMKIIHLEIQMTYLNSIVNGIIKKLKEEEGADIE